MKKIIKSFACVLFTSIFAMNPDANAFCGFGSISITPPTPTCSCPTNRVAIKRMVNNVCQEEKCVSTGAASHYLNQGWIYSCCAVARLDESKSTFEISIYPNPATDKFTVFYQESIAGKIEIGNALGQRVFSQQLKANSQQLTIDVSEWKKGVYFVTIKTNSNTVAEKILVK